MVETTEKLTLKQRKWLKAYLEPGSTYGNASESARVAGYKTRESGVENLSKPLMQKAFQELLDKNGLDDKSIMKSITEGLVATKIQNVNILLKRNSEGKLEAQDTDDFIEVPDYSVRHKYLETLIKLKQRFGTIEADPTGGKQAPFETYLIEFVRKNNATLKDRGIDGVKVARTEHRALDRFMEK